MATPRYFDEDGNEVFPTRPNGIVSAIIWIVLIATIALIWALAGPAMYARYIIGSTPSAPTPIGNVGGQAPPAARNAYQPAAPVAPLPNVAQSEQESLRIYQATAQASLSAPPAEITPVAAPLPLNSAGVPVIDAQQQRQLDQSAQMAADEQQAAQRQAQLTDAAGRAPDVSYADALAELHRDPCHVPRSDPATCAKGLFKPTPVQP